ncbi:MAG TPA: CGNR zinc finger domain-containing protein [Solirubrobacterales bacterium]|nr:CGNR zinc finger domain-containing protein [Solirubrobacterales bacterium]
MTSDTDTAPGRLELVRQFVNTRDIDDDLDDIATPAALEAWLAQHDLRTGPATDADVARFADVREGLRALLLANNGEPRDRDAIARLDAVAATVPVSVRFGDDSCALEPEGKGLEGALGSLLGLVHTAMRDGTFQRLKACREHTCAWAFYDHSRNRSATWCSMEVCGNRAKARAYRARHAKGKGKA